MKKTPHATLWLLHPFIYKLYGRIFDNKVVYEHTSLMMLIRFSCRLVLYWLILLCTYQFVNLNFRSYYIHYERFGQIVLGDSKSSFSSSIRYQLLDSLFFFFCKYWNRLNHLLAFSSCRQRISTFWILKPIYICSRPFKFPPKDRCTTI